MKYKKREIEKINLDRCVPWGIGITVNSVYTHRHTHTGVIGERFETEEQ